MPSDAPEADEAVQTCYRHPDRKAGVRCQRCERPICPSCMVGASVGFHCPECARSGRQKVLTARSLVVRPIATQVLIGLNVAVYVLVVTSGEAGFSDPLDLAVRAPDVANGEWWRIVTAGFIHYGLLHLGMNMLGLWLLGQQMEQALGRLKFVLLYFVALLAGSAGALLLNPGAFTGGASGAIFGLLGAAVAYQRGRGINLSDSGLATVLIINLGFTFLARNISIGGHLGGLVGGYVVGYVLFSLGPRAKTPGLAVAACAALGAACVAACLLIASNPIT